MFSTTVKYCALTFEPKQRKQTKTKAKEREGFKAGRSWRWSNKQGTTEEEEEESCAYTPGAHCVCVCVTERQVAESGSRGAGSCIEREKVIRIPREVTVYDGNVG